MAEKVPNIHREHRKRLREKFRNVGIDGFAEHELIELLLFYSIPVMNTNTLAHELKKEFGGLVNILNADEDHLISIKGMGENTLTLIKFIRECIYKYINEVNNISNVRLTPANINTYIKSLFFGHTREMLYAVLLDSDCVVKKVRKISVGTVNATPLYPREIVKFAVNEHYPYMILAHNHPTGDPLPSDEDLKITKSTELALNFIGVRLVDHVIVAGDTVTSISKSFNIFEE